MKTPYKYDEDYGDYMHDQKVDQQLDDDNHAEWAHQQDLLDQQQQDETTRSDSPRMVSGLLWRR